MSPEIFVRHHRNDSFQATFTKAEFTPRKAEHRANGTAQTLSLGRKRNKLKLEDPKAAAIEYLKL
jgi:hypothetical protein